MFQKINRSPSLFHRRGYKRFEVLGQDRSKIYTLQNQYVSLPLASNSPKYCGKMKHPSNLTVPPVWLFLSRRGLVLTYPGSTDRLFFCNESEVSPTAGCTSHIIWLDGWRPVYHKTALLYFAMKYWGNYILHRSSYWHLILCWDCGYIFYDDRSRKIFSDI